ncbi:MAG: hypothetical protein ACRCV5_24330 [Afipia sp.]
MFKFLVTTKDKPPRVIEENGRYDAANVAHLQDVGGSENLWHYFAAQVDGKWGDWGAEIYYPQTGRLYRVEYMKAD